MNIQTQELRTFNKEECDFGYRNSIFKEELKGQYIITSVIFELSSLQHVIKKKYGDIESELKNNGIENPTIQDISKAVISIRNSKLPNPKVLGNSGSFFKNPIVSMETLNRIQEQHSALDIELPFYPQDDGSIKIPAAWLLEYCNFKGFRRGSVGVHKDQALVLVNYNDIEGSDSARGILQLAQEIQRTVKTEFGIDLEVEPRIYGSL